MHKINYKTPLTEEVTNPTLLFAEVEVIKSLIHDSQPVGMRLDLEVLKERIVRMEMAIKLQAEEYERRLDSLNHEASRLAAMKNDFVPREVFETSVSEVLTKTELAMKTANEGIHDLRMTNKDNVTIRALWVVSLGIIGVILSIVKLFIHP